MAQLTNKLTVLGTLCAAIAIAGCGGGGGGDKAASPLDDALGYLPKDPAFVVAIDTDPKGSQFKSAEAILEKFPFSNQVKSGIKNQLNNQSFDYDRDLKPLLGNRFVVGVDSARALTGDSDSSDQFVGAIKAKDGDKLQDAVKREKAKEDGEKNGAKIYKDNDGDPFAIKDDVLIVAGSKKVLEAALEQREADDRLTEDTFDRGTAGLPKQSAVRVFSDLHKLIASDPDTRDARKVKWVAALKTLGVTASIKDDEIDVDFKVNTDKGDLADSDLPLAAGPDSPAVIDRAGDIGLGLKDPGQIVKFAESAGQAVNPSGFGDYETGKRTIEQRLGVSIDDDLLGQLEGDVTASVGLDGKFGAKAELKDPAAFKKTLAKLGKVLPDVAKSVMGGRAVGYAKPKKGQDFYALATADGQSVVYGVVDGSFVIANDPARAGRLARETTKQVPGASGSLVMNADAGQLVTRAISRFGGSQAQGLGGALGGALFAGPLGDLSGSVESSTSGLTGNFKLTFD